MERYKDSNTNLNLVFQVKSLANGETLGNMLREVLITLDALPFNSMPQKNLEEVQVYFETDNEKSHFQFSLAQWRHIRDQKLTGSELLEALGSTLGKDTCSTL